MHGSQVLMTCDCRLNLLIPMLSSPGYYVPVTGLSYQTICPITTFTPTSGYHFCHYCPWRPWPGTYGDEDGLSVCKVRLCGVTVSPHIDILDLPNRKVFIRVRSYPLRCIVLLLLLLLVSSITCFSDVLSTF